MHQPDTTAEAEQLYDEKIRQLSAQEKFSKGLSLTSFCREVCWESLRQAHGNLSQKELKVYFFERIYGTDFSDGIKKDIHDSLRK